MIRRFLLLAAIMIGLPCAAQNSSLVIVSDTAVGGGRDGATFFYLQEVDGQSVGENNLQLSIRASRGRGPDMRVQQFSRGVPAGLRRLKLVARVAYAAPIQTLFKSGSTLSAEGVVEVELVPGINYRVAGLLDAFRRELWLEEDESGKQVGAKIIDAADALARSAEMAGASYTCCNLRYEGDWISDESKAMLPFVPAGSRIAVKGYGRYRAEVLIEGRPMRIGQDYGREQESREQFVAKLMVKDDPRLKLASYAPEMQQAIRRGLVALGMTREQVLMSLGHPRTDLTRSLDSPRWRYATMQDDEYVLVWGPDQTVQQVEAIDGVKRLVMYPPE